MHVSDASHLCTKQRLKRSSPCGLFWSQLANGEVPRLVRFSDLSISFWQKKDSKYLVHLSIPLQILSRFHRISWDVYTLRCDEVHIDIGVGPTRPPHAAWRPRAVLTLALLVSTMAAMAIINPMNSMDDGEIMRRLKTSENLSHFFS